MLFALAVLQAQGAHSHVADAKREYAFIISRPGKVCVGADESTTAGYLTCKSNEVTFLQSHFDAFMTAIQGVEADTSPAMLPGGSKMSSVQLLDKTTASWKIYRDNLCRLAFSGYEGGTGAAPAEQQCFYGQDRAYVKSIASWTQSQILAD